MYTCPSQIKPVIDASSVQYPFRCQFSARPEINACKSLYLKRQIAQRSSGWLSYTTSKNKQKQNKTKSYCIYTVLRVSKPSSIYYCETLQTLKLLWSRGTFPRKIWFSVCTKLLLWYTRTTFMKTILYGPADSVRVMRHNCQARAGLAETRVILCRDTSYLNRKWMCESEKRTN